MPLLQPDPARDQPVYLPGMRKAKKPEVPALLHLLYHDAWEPTVYDWNPAGGFILDKHGRVAIAADLHVWLPQSAWERPEAFDRAIIRLLTRAAEQKPAGFAPTILHRLNDRISSSLPPTELFQIVANPKTLAKLKEHLHDKTRTWETPFLKHNTFIALSEPELVGLTTGHGLKSYGAGIRNPEYIVGFRIVSKEEMPEIGP